MTAKSLIAAVHPRETVISRREEPIEITSIEGGSVAKAPELIFRRGVLLGVLFRRQN
jgi:hypothetical protein